WTAYGGSQFVDSPGTGRYHSYLCEEVVPFVDARYRTLADRAHRAISGKSSGGFGAAHLLMMLGISACFSARSDGTPELPFDRARACCARRRGSAGWTGIRCGWRRGTPTRRLPLPPRPVLALPPHHLPTHLI